LYSDTGDDAYDYKRCSICQKELDGGDSPWSICFDQDWKINVWGGDSHLSRGLFCQECAELIIGHTAENTQP